jgi:hypothetical protein
MPFKFKNFRIPRFYGLDLKTNLIDVKDGFSLGCSNVFQNRSWVITKRNGNDVMFASDEDATLEIAEIGAATLAGTKYYFKFVDGDFRYSTTLTGAVTSISPSPAIDTSSPVSWAVLDDKVFFVDGTNNLRFFDGTTITDSIIYTRPTVVMASASGGTGFDYTYTVDNGLGESPASANVLLNKPAGGAITITIQGNTGPQTLVAGDILRVYAKATAVAVGYKLVYTYTWTPTDVLAGSKTFDPAAIDDSQPQLYSELGVALNKTAPVLTGITKHYGRLVGWVNEEVHNSKSSNPHSWPDDAANKEAFVYRFGVGDGQPVVVCRSFRESLFVMKKKDIAVFAGVGPDDTGNNAYAFRRLETNGIGCIAAKSAVVVGEQGKQFLVYLSRQGFYATTGDSPIRIGENIETVIQTFTESNLSNACGFFHEKDGFYLCFMGSPSGRIGWALDTREDNKITVGWFRWDDLNPRCVYWDEDRYLFGDYEGVCHSERMSGTSLDFSDAEVEYFTTTAVDTAADTISLTGSYQTGDEARFRGAGGVPAGLTTNTTYYLIRMSATIYKVATSHANAILGTFINLTTTGSDPMSIVTKSPISAYYSTNWLHFNAPSNVKKLLKPSIILNAIAASVNISMTTAYDWVDTFGDPHAITVGSTDPWGSLPWGVFVWGAGANASPRNISTSRRKIRSIRYKFLNNTLNQDFNLQGIEQEFSYIRNRGNYQDE